MTKPSRLLVLALAIAFVGCTDSSLTVNRPDTPEQAEEATPPEQAPDGLREAPPRFGLPDGTRFAGDPATTRNLYVPSARLAIRFASAPEAGVPTAYTVQVFHDELDVTSEYTIDVAVEPDLSVVVTTETITFNLAGSYKVTAVARRPGQVVEGGIEVTVGAGAPESIDVTVDPEVVRAGELLDFAVTAEDAAGNSVDPAGLGLDMWLMPGTVPVDPSTGELTLTEVGRYELHAETGTGIHDAAVFHVVPNDPEFIDLTLAEHGILEPGQTLDYTVTAADRYGNAIDEIAGLVVHTEPDGGVVDTRRIEFVDEGIFEVVAEVEGTSLEDREGPVTVDGFGPLITITSPERGIFTRSTSMTVRGTVTDAGSGVEHVELNGETLTLDAGGGFEHTVSSVEGVNLIEVGAWDYAGHESGKVQSFLFGYSFVQPGNRIYDSLVARLNQGTIDMLEDWVEDAFDASDVRSLVLDNPRIYYGCVDVWVYEPCAWVDATNFTMSTFTVSMVPRNGYVDLTARIYSPNVRIHLNGDWPVPSLWGNVTASRGDLTGRLYLSASTNGNITANLTNINVNLVNFFIDLDAIPSWLSFIEGWISGWVESDVEGAIRTSIRDQAPEALDAALSELQIGDDIDVLGTTIAYDAIPTYIQTTTSGISMFMATIVEADEVAQDMEGLGALRTWSPRPTYNTTPGFMLSMSDDFFNQVLYALWESGSLSQLFEDELVPDLDTSFIDTLFPGSTGVEFEIDPLLPPVFRPGWGWGSIGEFQMGDAMVDIYATYDGAPRQLVAQVAVSLFAQAWISFTDDNTVQVALVNDPTFLFDGVLSTLPDITKEDLAGLLESLVPVMLPSLVDAVQEFPLPSFQGMTIGSPSVTLVGDELDFLNFQGNLVLQ